MYVEKEKVLSYWNCMGGFLAATEWIPGWKRNNWIKKTDSKPVLNKDLMVKIDDLQGKLKLKWVGLIKTVFNAFLLLSV